MIAWIIGIVALLVISLLITDKNVEPFDYNPPTVVSTKIRRDLTCSDPESSDIFDRYDKSGPQLMGSRLMIPPNLRNPTLSGLPTDQILQTTDTAKEEYYNECIGLTDKNNPDYNKKKGTKIFIEKDEKYKLELPNGTRYTGKYVDLFCCKGEMYQPPGTFSQDMKVCLPECPSNYEKSSRDPTVCIRYDSTCTYTSDLSANIQNNWFKTCAALYKQNTNITSTIQSISTVVSTFSIQSSTIKTNYDLLKTKLNTYYTTYSLSTDPDRVSKITNYNNKFTNISNTYSNLYSNIQSNISDRYNTLQSDKLRFDTLFNNLGCSNFM